MRRQAVNLLRSLALSGGETAKLSNTCAAGGLFVARSFADDAALKKTVLYDYHVAQGGKMVPFAGWSMPIQYKDSIMDSTLHCRTHASIFDVSHMCGLTLKGKDAVKFLEGLVVGDIAGLADGTGTLSVFTNEKGGIIDDTVVTKVSPDELYIVVNAGCREKDLAHLGKHLDAFKAKGGQVDMEVHDDRSLLALQGPEAVAVLQQHVSGTDLDKVYFSNFRKLDIKGIPCFLTRTGYTGEDGFELSIPNDSALELCEALMADSRVRMCGLGPRDSLRLEAGLCLYGNDLNEDITPVEAGLTWTVGKRRREAFDFLGGEIIKQQIAEGVSMRRVGLVSSGAPARQHCEIVDGEGKKVGEVTSGAFSPCLKKNIAMGYVDKVCAKAGTQLKINVRGKMNDATVTKMPFVPTHYHKP
ncbi:Aminomethyltransferase [Chlorella vulgaris]